MSIMYCVIPHPAVSLARRQKPELADYPLVVIGPQERVLDASVEAVSCGVTGGMTAQMTRVRCPEARIVEADLVRCREVTQMLLDILERFSPTVEPHGIHAAYVDLSSIESTHNKAVALCSACGQQVRQELGEDLQPALGWNQSKFTSQAAAQSTHPGRLMAVDARREHDFLGPLPTRLLPLTWGTQRRLTFLGLRTLGQYAALPEAAVWQQFGRAGRRAHAYARGEDKRPVYARRQLPHLTAGHDLDVPCNERQRLLAILGQMIAPLLSELRETFRACGHVRLTVHMDDDNAQEQTRFFYIPTAQDTLVERALQDLLDRIHWRAGATALSISLGEIQEAAIGQLSLFEMGETKTYSWQKVQHYLASRFGAGRLWRAALIRPGAPLAEWRVDWEREEGG